MSDVHGDAYAALRTRVTEVIAAAAPDAVDRVAPATPQWTVREVLAHLVGVTDDIVHGRLEGIATDAWTAVHVERRADVSADALLDEWELHSPLFEKILREAPAEIAGQAVFDAVTHEHDIRNALDAAGARDSDAVVIAWEWAVEARTRGRMPAIRFVTETGAAVAGTGDPAASVGASRFELMRASTGRRSLDEIARYDWDPAPLPDLLLAGPIFRFRSTPLAE